MTDHALAPVVRGILRSAAAQVMGFDAELATDLVDLADDYAGPYVGPQVSDEEGDRK